LITGEDNVNFVGTEIILDQNIYRW